MLKTYAENIVNIIFYKYPFQTTCDLWLWAETLIFYLFCPWRNEKSPSKFGYSSKIVEIFSSFRRRSKTSQNLKFCFIKKAHRATYLRWLWAGGCQVRQNGCVYCFPVWLLFVLWRFFCGCWSKSQKSGFRICLLKFFKRCTEHVLLF